MIFIYYILKDLFQICETILLLLKYDFQRYNLLNKQNKFIFQAAKKLETFKFSDAEEEKNKKQLEFQGSLQGKWRNKLTEVFILPFC